jgi:precorrin-4/cobalt-precorrin-4 C11-methyltransferase
MTRVYIVAGGPGDPELVTLKGQRIIDSADIIFSSARFVSPEVFKNQKAGGKIYDNFAYSYDEKLQIIKEAVQAGKTTVFVTMGDPCLYGMIGGLGDRLEKAGIEYEIVPGVSAFNASAALIKRGMTGLGLSNTAVCTTLHDREDAEAYLTGSRPLGRAWLFLCRWRRWTSGSVLKRHYPMTRGGHCVQSDWPDQRLRKGLSSSRSKTWLNRKILPTAHPVWGVLSDRHMISIWKENSCRERKG